MRFYRFSRSTQAWGALGAAWTTLGAIPFLRFLYVPIQGEGMGDMQSLMVGAVLLLLGALMYAVRSLVAFASWSRAVNEDQSLWEKIDTTQRRASANDALAMNGENREHIGRKSRAA
ncbi:MAG: hypothetical protein IIB87_02765 [Chloroflexi bacterium]|nr:hypothetical protein [Chloroflexota bacterium]